MQLIPKQLIFVPSWSYISLHADSSRRPFIGPLDLTGQCQFEVHFLQLPRWSVSLRLWLFIGASLQCTGPRQFDTPTDFGWAGPQMLELAKTKLRRKHFGPGEDYADAEGR